MIVGILGGGQLGRMLALAGYPLGLRFRLLDPAAASPGGHLAELRVGPYDEPSVLHQFAKDLTVATYEFENVPEIAARTLGALIPVYPPPAALEAAQDRLAEKALFERLAIPVPPYAAVSSVDELHAAMDRVGLPAVLKTRRLGYDGKGQSVLHPGDDPVAAWSALGGVPCVLEQLIPLRRELSVLAVRARDGATGFYPLVENVHRAGILRTSIAPAPDSGSVLQAAAEAYAARILQALEYVGVLALELFVDDRDGRLLANEIAPRVHNSGHWTIEGAEASQFENHLRAVLGWPLGSTAPRGHAAMVNLIGDTPPIAELLAVAGAHVHLYGKSPRPGRKIGHVNVCAETAAARDELVAQIARLVGPYAT
jgi:5-(carboxyamino)imidazole ribonucleotide synthase